VHFRDLEIRILNLFRILKFELRICNGKLDQLVNFVRTKKTENPSPLGKNSSLRISLRASRLGG